MASTWVLKFAQVDKPQQPILIHVTQKQGTALVDLDLLATDGEEAYRGKVRQRNLSKLQSKNFEGTEKEWTALLHYTLVSKRESDASEEHTRNLEVDCSISGNGPKATLSIVLRSRIEDITHKLGAIELTYSENTDDVDLFGWATQLADQRDELERQAAMKSKEADAAKGMISDLEKQLASLVTAKNEHEEQLLSKFVLLLNEKKLKIRNQQRILQTAKVNKKTLDALQLSVSGDQLNAGSSKRKRDDVIGGDDDDDESDGFDDMDVDQKHDEVQEHDGSGQETPPRSGSPETETASEDDEPSALPTKPADTSKVTSAKGKARATSPPPPPRQLPFEKRPQKAEAAKKSEPTKQAIPGEDEETASEDDEL